MFFRDLETNRLLLRNLCQGDGDFLFRQFSNEDVTRYLYDEEPYTKPEEANALVSFYTSPEPRAQHRWILVLKESGQPVGTCGFHRWDGQEARAEIGYDMRKEFWGKGLMREAAEEILRFAKEEMRLKTVVAHISVANERSIALAQRLGFAKGGETILYTFRNAEYPHDVYTLSILKN